MAEVALPDTSRFTTRVVKGSLWTLAGRVTLLFVSMVTAPIVIRLVGPEAYGVLALLLIIPQFLYFADFGMSLASTKFGSAAFAVGDPEREARVVRTAAVVALTLSVPVAGTLALFSSEVAVTFNVPVELVAEASTSIKISGATLVLTLLGLIVTSPQLARLRMDLNSLVSSGTRIAGMIATPLVIYLGFGIVGATTVLFVAALANLLGHAAISARLLPQLLGFTTDRESIGALLRFGWPWCIGVIASMAIANLERGAVSALASVTELAYYSVAFSLASILNFASAAMNHSLMPVFSQLQSEIENDRRNAIYNRSFRMIVIGSLPLIGFAGITGELVITLFAGPEFGRESTLPFYILLVGVASAIGGQTPLAALIASGRTDRVARLYWLELPPYAVLVWFLVSRYGSVGAAIAWTVRVIVDAVLQFTFAAMYAGVTLERRKLASLLLAAIISALPFALYLLFELNLFQGLALGVATLAAYAVVVWRFVLFPEEMEWARERIRTAVLDRRTAA